MAIVIPSHAYENPTKVRQASINTTKYSRLTLILEQLSISSIPDPFAAEKDSMRGKQKTDKKKGPKGKKARAKAKLDRQWGETPITENEKLQGTKRVGNSRLLAKKRISNDKNTDNNHSSTRGRSVHWDKENVITKTPSGGNKFTRRNRVSNDSDSDDEVIFSDSDNESEMESAPALSGLLTSIQKSKKMARKNKKKQTMQTEVSDDGDDDIADDEDLGDRPYATMDDDSVSSDESIQDNEMMIDQGEQTIEEDDDSDNDDNLGDDDPAIDHFRGRFSRKPLESSELEARKEAPITKVVVGSRLELQASTPSLVGKESNDLPFDQKNTTIETWRSLAESSFRVNRKAIQNQWKRLHGEAMSDGQVPIYPLLTRYMDLLVTTESRKNRKEMHQLYQLHILNHVLTSRGRIQRHNRQLKEREEMEKDDEVPLSTSNEDNDELFRDQGFTRPTVLVLLPTRGTCHTFVQSLSKMAGIGKDCQHMDRFEEEYGKVNDDDDEEEAPVDAQKEQRRKQVLSQKGKDWNEIFGDNVNKDDDFKIGISLTPKASQKDKKKKDKGPNSKISMRLYSDFYKSDIIVASPLGLKMLVSPDEEGKASDFDYLSSIEICLLQHADILLMQNWDHVNFVLGLLNKSPEKNNDTDFSRVRNYMLEGQAAHWRQLIFSTDIIDPFLLSAFKRFGLSISGSVKIRQKIEPVNAALANVLVPMKQVFQKIPVASFDKQSEARVNFFVKTILPQIQRQNQKHTMVYIPSYFDFVALRNVFLKQDVSFVSVHEYSRVTEVSRGRARFLQGRRPIMLYTGRCNFFYRHMIKGVRHLIFLGLPEHPQFYSEQVNAIETDMKGFAGDNVDAAEASGTSCLALFTKFEGHALDRIVGNSNCSRMLKSEKSTFMFHS